MSVTNSAFSLVIIATSIDMQCTLHSMHNACMQAMCFLFLCTLNYQVSAENELVKIIEIF